jgi:glycerate kinase
VKVLIAPDKFAGTLSATQAASAMARGWHRARPQDEVVLAPLADGGEGTLEVVASAVPGCERVDLDVLDARGIATPASWLRLPDGRALVESAEACGLRRLPDDQRDPLRATTYGVGQLLASAAAHGATQILVGLGGSATVDGGAGMATALGHRLLRADGNAVHLGTALGLVDLVRIEPAGGFGVPVRAAVDVTAPLLGPDGAAVVFGPQKGAAPDDVPVLEDALTVLVEVAERDLPGGPWRDLPGAGAAGGLGFGLAAFCGAELSSGADLVAGLVGFTEAMDGAEVLLTGEGSLDGQTAAGKGPAYVLARGRERGVPVLAIAGRIADGAGAAYDEALGLGPEGLTRAWDLVVERTADIATRWPRIR